MAYPFGTLREITLHAPPLLVVAVHITPHLPTSQDLVMSYHLFADSCFAPHPRGLELCLKHSRCSGNMGPWMPGWLLMARGVRWWPVLPTLSAGTPASRRRRECAQGAPPGPAGELWDSQTTALDRASPDNKYLGGHEDKEAQGVYRHGPTEGGWRWSET